ncbi:MAG: hypothetical protein SFW35_00325 [Chitinophagales bacterium]|nr:hypothetical protein [Chitinophagales bacterium]
MENSKLISLFKTFSTKELREFGDFVESPFFNKNEELVKFFAYLRKQAPEFSPKKVSREAVFKALYPKQPYDDKLLNYLMSFLLKLAEQYLGYSQLAEQETLHRYYTLQACVQRKLEKHYQLLHSQAVEKLEQYPHRNNEYYYHRYLLADLANQHFLKQMVRKYDERLQQAADNFDQYFLAGKLKYCCEMLDRRNSLEADYQLYMLDEVLAYVSANPQVHTPPIAIYHTVLLMLIHQMDTDYFGRLKQLLEQYKGQFPQPEYRDIYMFGINYCIRKVNQGDQHFLEQLFQLYKDAFESNLLVDDGFLSPWAYKNMIGVGLRLKKFDFTELFIREYNNKLAPDFRENALYYNLAELFYYKKDYSKALENLNKVEFSDIYYQLDTKKMMLKIYFELDEIDALYSLIASFRIFLRRTRLISEANKEAYVNFLHMVNLLVKRDKSMLSEIKEKIATTSPLADRKWLKEVCDKMEKLRPV